jgi:branched-chain amino acid transport system substrate-binding protein
MTARRPILLLALGVLALASCSAPPGRRSVVSELDAADRERAEEAYQVLLEAERSGDAKATYEAGIAMLDRYPGAASEPHALLLTADAAARLGNDRAQERLLRLLVRDHPGDPWAVEGWYELAAFERERGRWASEADALAWFDRTAPAGDVRRDGVRARLLEIMREELDVEELDRLVAAHPRTALTSTGTWLAARKVYDTQTHPEEAGERLEAFLRDFPRSRYAEDARALLAELSQLYGREADPGLAGGRADRIGLLAPLTGEYAALGQALFDGALLAVEEQNRAHGTSLALVSRDTRGDEVAAVQVARELVETEQVISIVGALLSSTTVAVATLCEERGVPLVSPTATKETIKDLGPYVFQTNLTKEVETRLLARVAVHGMMRSRFAILYPDTEEGSTIAARFVDELESQGGRVVAQAAFDPEVTDFAEEIRRLRAAAPEALFVPATPTLMRLIAPQLVFHDLRAELFGPSSWNNGMLLREAGASMEQAVVPSDVALIPEARRERFEELWGRRFPNSPSTAIGLKGYLAAVRVIEALDPEGGDTRARLRSRLERGLEAPDPAATEDSSQPLRVIRDGRLEALPVALLPGLAPRDIEPQLEEYPAPPDPDQPEP